MVIPGQPTAQWSEENHHSSTIQFLNFDAIIKNKTEALNFTQNPLIMVIIWDQVDVDEQKSAIKVTNEDKTF